MSTGQAEHEAGRARVGPRRQAGLIGALPSAVQIPERARLLRPQRLLAQDRGSRFPDHSVACARDALACWRSKPSYVERGSGAAHPSSLMVALARSGDRRTSRSLPVSGSSLDRSAGGPSRQRRVNSSAVAYASVTSRSRTALLLLLHFVSQGVGFRLACDRRSLVESGQAPVARGPGRVD